MCRMTPDTDDGCYGFRDPGTRRQTIPIRSLIFLLCGALGTTLWARENSKTVTLTQKDNATSVTLSAGDHIVVRLPVTEGTGYTWQLKDEREILPLEGEPELEHSSETKPGQTGTQVFRFVAKDKGDAPLAFRLIRPWEKEVRPLKTYTVKVRIR